MSSVGDASGDTSPTIATNMSKFSVEKALSDAMDDDRMADVTLVGRCGVGVRAIKYVIACQCPALKDKLYDDPSKAQIVIGDYSESVLHALKEYCYTSSINKSLLSKESIPGSIHQLVELASLASAYKFEALLSLAKSTMRQIFDEAPWLAAAAFDVATKDRVGDFEAVLFNFIKKRCPYLMMETHAIQYLNPGRLYDFVDMLNCNDAEALLYVMKWVAARGPTRENIEHAKAIVTEKVNLANLLADPALVLVARSSGLFDMQEIDACILLHNGRPFSNMDDDCEEENDKEFVGEMNPMPDSLSGDSNHKKLSSPTTPCYQLTPGGEITLLNM